MAYIEPKTNWIASNIPIASDFNRIEGNTKQNHDDIVSANADIASANADIASANADIAAEEAQRISVDATKLSSISLGARTFISLYVDPSSEYIPSAGAYYVFGEEEGFCRFYLKTNDGVDRAIIVNSESGLVICDGINTKWKNISVSVRARVSMAKIS